MTEVPATADTPAPAMQITDAGAYTEVKQRAEASPSSFWEPIAQRQHQLIDAPIRGECLAELVQRIA